MFYDILDTQRISLLPLMEPLKQQFYLAGGTALALQLGHRDSVDFDFFTPEQLDTKTFFSRLTEVFAEHTVVNIQEERNTLSVLIDGAVQLSFFSYPYTLLQEVVDEEHIRLASVLDIGCMKLSAITGRGSNKDYIDLYYILHDIPLSDLLDAAERKFPDIDSNVIRKALVYFEDVHDEPIIFKNGKDVSFEEVKQFLIAQMRALHT